MGSGPKSDGGRPATCPDTSEKLHVESLGTNIRRPKSNHRKVRNSFSVSRLPARRGTAAKCGTQPGPAVLAHERGTRIGGRVRCGPPHRRGGGGGARRGRRFDRNKMGGGDATGNVMPVTADSHERSDRIINGSPRDVIEGWEATLIAMFAALEK
ncbi:hypothetical protein BHE74_00030991 [Ensete ventricosum]|nr:hypothetical protein BHE74_00030991 [Ensete ventricosum]